jgi:hypothetical protein
MLQGHTYHASHTSHNGGVQCHLFRGMELLQPLRMREESETTLGQTMQGLAGQRLAVGFAARFGYETWEARVCTCLFAVYD